MVVNLFVVFIIAILFEIFGSVVIFGRDRLPYYNYVRMYTDREFKIRYSHKRFKIVLVHL